MLTICIESCNRALAQSSAEMLASILTAEYNCINKLEKTEYFELNNVKKIVQVITQKQLSEDTEDAEHNTNSTGLIFIYVCCLLAPDDYNICGETTEETQLPDFQVTHTEHVKIRSSSEMISMLDPSVIILLNTHAPQEIELNKQFCTVPSLLYIVASQEHFDTKLVKEEIIEKQILAKKLKELPKLHKLDQNQLQSPQPPPHPQAHTEQNKEMANRLQYFSDDEILKEFQDRKLIQKCLSTVQQQLNASIDQPQQQQQQQQQFYQNAYAQQQYNNQQQQQQQQQLYNTPQFVPPQQQSVLQPQQQQQPPPLYYPNAYPQMQNYPQLPHPQFANYAPSPPHLQQQSYAAANMYAPPYSAMPPPNSPRSLAQVNNRFSPYK
jgi:hypothetical protein